MNVIWDLGNVVLHWNPQELIDSLAINQLEKQLLLELIFEHQIWNDLDAGKITETDVITQLVSNIGLSKKLLIHAFDAARASLTLIESSADMMKQLKHHGIRQFCLSNMSNETYGHIKGWPFFKFFEGIFISAQEGYIKPDPKTFSLMLLKFNLQAENTLFIDDSYANIESASRLGMNVVHFDRSNACYDEIWRRLNLPGDRFHAV